ncbi:glycosyltransferase [Proteus mirabilis]|uniref:glycosyltransferase n=1 Tax=Proteus mirabilis TaxID=584 RepID=UPI0039B5CF22
MKEHILFIIDGLPGGGAENVTLRLCHGLSQCGYQVTLLSLAEKCDYAIPANIELLIDADSYHGLFYRQTELKRRANSMDKTLQALFARKGIPALIVSNLHKTDRIVALSKQLADKNVWYCIHGIFSQSYLGNKKGFSRWLKQKKIQKVYQGKNIITVSNAAGQDLIENIKIIPNQLKTIYNPFDIQEIRTLASENNPYQKQDYLLHIGRFHQVKRHDRLLEAFALADLPCKLLIAGQGSPEVTSNIKNKIVALNLENKVSLIGFLANPFPVIKGAKAVVLSSDSEGLGNVLVESLICNTPIVSTNCLGGISEIMEGELADYKSELNSTSLAEKMHLAFFNPPKITPNMYQKFDIDEVIHQYISLI